MNQKRDEKVKSIVRKFLKQRFTDNEFVFDPIVVIPTYDEWGPHATGELYLRIIIVFDGDQKNLAPSWTGRLIGRVHSRLIEEGIEELPHLSWVAKSEWPWLERQERRLLSRESA